MHKFLIVPILLGVLLGAASCARGSLIIDATTTVQDAVRRTMALQSYRVESVTRADGKDVSRIQGIVHGNDQQFTYWHGIENETGEQEFLGFGGQMYQRDSKSKSAWLEVSNTSVPQSAQSSLSVFNQLLGDLSTPYGYVGSDIPFVWKSKETVDAMSCDLYVQALKLQIGAHFEMTVCPDGYWHRGRMTVSIESGSMDRIISTTMTTSLSDLNAPLTIEAARVLETVPPAPVSVPRLIFNKHNRNSNAADNTDIYLGRIDQSSEQRVIIGDTLVAVSPNGAHLAFSRYCGPQACLMVANIDGSNVIRVGQAEGDSPKWSPDGCQLLDVIFRGSARDQIFVINVDGSGYHEIARGQVLQWMPNSQEILFWRDSRMYLINADGTSEKVLPPLHAYAARLSPDGKQMFYREKFSYPDVGPIFIMDFPDGEGKTVAVGFPEDWSPDGKRLIYTGETNKKVPPTMTIINADGTDPFVLPVRGFEPRWSPDGSMIAYQSSWKEEDSFVHVVNVDGTGDRELYRGTFPKWVPATKSTKCN